MRPGVVGQPVAGLGHPGQLLGVRTGVQSDAEERRRDAVALQHVQDAPGVGRVGTVVERERDRPAVPLPVAVGQALTGGGQRGELPLARRDPGSVVGRAAGEGAPPPAPAGAARTAGWLRCAPGCRRRPSRTPAAPAGATDRRDAPAGRPPSGRRPPCRWCSRRRRPAAGRRTRSASGGARSARRPVRPECGRAVPPARRSRRPAPPRSPARSTRSPRPACASSPRRVPFRDLSTGPEEGPSSGIASFAVSPESPDVPVLPTAELHLHIEGTLEPELAFALAARNGVAPAARRPRRAARGPTPSPTCSPSSTSTTSYRGAAAAARTSPTWPTPTSPGRRRRGSGTPRSSSIRRRTPAGACRWRSSSRAWQRRSAGAEERTGSAPADRQLPA